MREFEHGYLLECWNLSRGSQRDSKNAYKIIIKGRVEKCYLLFNIYDYSDGWICINEQRDSNREFVFKIL
jgi:hypothetical protein